MFQNRGGARTGGVNLFPGVLFFFLVRVLHVAKFLYFAMMNCIKGVISFATFPFSSFRLVSYIKCFKNASFSPEGH